MFMLMKNIIHTLNIHMELLMMNVYSLILGCQWIEKTKE